MEFATEDEMYEMLGDKARGFNTGYGWASRVPQKHEETDNDLPVKKVLIGASVGSGILYLAAKNTTFVKALAKQFDEQKADAKVAAMNKKGNYKWKKIPLV